MAVKSFERWSLHECLPFGVPSEMLPFLVDAEVRRPLGVRRLAGTLNPK